MLALSTSSVGNSVRNKRPREGPVSLISANASTYDAAVRWEQWMQQHTGQLTTQLSLSFDGPAVAGWEPYTLRTKRHELSAAAQAAISHMTQLQSLRLSDLSISSSTANGLLSPLKELTQLCLINCSLDGAVVDGMRFLTNLQELNLAGSRLGQPWDPYDGSDVLKCFRIITAKLTNLLVLDLTGFGMADYEYTDLEHNIFEEMGREDGAELGAAFPRLAGKRQDLYNAQFNVLGPGLRRLRCLTLSSVSSIAALQQHISETSCKSITVPVGLPGMSMDDVYDEESSLADWIQDIGGALLQHLGLHNRSGNYLPMSETLLEVLHEMPSLHSLRLVAYGLRDEDGDDAMQQLAACTQLTCLELEQCIFSRSSVQLFAAALPNLSRLQLTLCGVTGRVFGDHGLSYLGQPGLGLTALRFLTSLELGETCLGGCVTGCSDGTVKLTPLAGLTQLQRLLIVAPEDAIFAAQIKADELPYLAGLTGLTQLILDQQLGEPYSSAAAATLLQLQRLRILDTPSCTLTPEVAVQLTQLSQLRYLAWSIHHPMGYEECGTVAYSDGQMSKRVEFHDLHEGVSVARLQQAFCFRAMLQQLADFGALAEVVQRAQRLQLQQLVQQLRQSVAQLQQQQGMSAGPSSGLPGLTATMQQLQTIVQQTKLQVLAALADLHQLAYQTLQQQGLLQEHNNMPCNGVRRPAQETVAAAEWRQVVNGLVAACQVAY